VAFEPNAGGWRQILTIDTEAHVADLKKNAMAKIESYAYVYVNADGTARELHSNERQYLETEFLPGDGAAPSVKDSYAERNGWGEIKGYLERSKIPKDTLIQEAPKEDPTRLMNVDELAEWLRGKGAKVTVRGKEQG
jgi:hypothetical protein